MYPTTKNVKVNLKSPLRFLAGSAGIIVARIPVERYELGIGVSRNH